MKTQLTNTECYRLDTEEEANAFIEEAKKNAFSEGYVLSKYSSVLKEKKAKGEVIDAGYLVTVVKTYNNFYND